ncbi:hypothetical protein NM688_g378 [Phlebia brevispora]|uniref:Uncharacterized protein n=1 Tax=Phlebia brevispora TaxID=194682 RepID=A0ACC1TFA6_9APHY|nr:hypothetical protein NM688_g378 [Phlebia brevispora]
MAGTRVDRSKKPYSRPAPRRRSEGEWLHDKAPDAPASRPVASTATQPATTANSKLIVSNLHYEAIFGQIGTLVREPMIRYDRSGRSSGVAIITYETPAEGKRAQMEYNGKLCKGQPMTIEFHTAPPTRPQVRRSTSAPSLINRIQKPPLLDRLSQKNTKSKIDAQSSSLSGGLGPVRTKGRGARAPREPKKPKTAQELDMELDAFMKDDAKPATAQNQTEDVEMTS